MAEKFEVIIGAVDQASPVLDKFQTHLKEVQNTSSQVTDSLVKLGDQSRWAFLGLSGSVAVATKSFTDFEDAMAKVATQLPGELISHYDEMKTSVQDLSQEYGQSTSDMAQGLYDILSAAIPAEDALGLLSQTCNHESSACRPMPRRWHSRLRFGLHVRCFRALSRLIPSVPSLPRQAACP